MADDVRLTDLQVIQRYSIAVRGETADRDDLIGALRADLAWLQGGSSRSRRFADDDVDRAPAPARRTAPVKRAAAKKTVKKAAKPARRSR